MGAAALAAAVAFASLQLAPGHAEAQCDVPSPTCSRVTPDAKGMIGLGLIGAEIGFIVPALVQEAMHTNEWWPYLVFPVVGAGLGVLSGFFVEEATTNQPEIDVALLAIGMALIVPTMVGTLALTAYDPGDSAEQMPGDQGEDEPVYEDETSTEAVQVEDTSGDQTPPPPEAAPADDGGSTSLQRRMDRLLAGGPGLLRFDGAQVLLGVPMVRRLATYTTEEQRALQLTPTSDVNIPLISATF